jgi:hypothetical protein
MWVEVTWIREESRRVRRANVINDFNDKTHNTEDVDGRAIGFWAARVA